VTDRVAAPHTHHVRVQRTARFYTLGGEHEAPRTVWFVLHGYGQLAGQFIRYFADLATPDALLVAPEAMNRFYLVPPSKAPAGERPVGATWMTREDRASEIADYVEYLDTLYDDVAAPAARSGAAVRVIGVSQGAATATRWITHGRARIDQLILWGGLLPPEIDLARGAAVLRHVPLTIVLGDADQYVTSEQLATQEAALGAAGLPVRVIKFAGGHVVRRALFPELVASDPSAESPAPRVSDASDR
jgi:predicted esterase